MGIASGRARCSLALTGVLAGVLFACPCALALDPALDVSQYAHASWKIREGFAKNAISAIAQTPDGYLWLGTDFGLLRFDGIKATPWQPPAGQQLPSNRIVNLFTARDGTLWIGTFKGLACLRKGNLLQYPELAGLLVGPLVEDHDETVWAGGFSYTPPGKLCAIHKGGVRCYGEHDNLGNGVLGLYEDRKGNLWAGVRDGLWRWKPGPAQFYPLAGEPNGIQVLGEDTDGALLIGMTGRVARFMDGKTETAYTFPGPARNFIRDRDGGFWIGTITQGLIHGHQGKEDVFAQTDGLSGNTVFTLFEDREGNIWVSTTNGLDRFRNYAVTTFSVNQGVASAREGSVLAARDGSVWLGTHGFLGKWNNRQVTIYHALDTRAGNVPARARGGVQEAAITGLPKHEVLSLFQDNRGRIWIAANGGFGYLENERFIAVTGVPGGIVYSMAGDSQGNIWVSDLDRGLFHLFKDKLVQNIPWAGLGREDYASALAVDPAGGLWLGFANTGLAYWANGEIRASHATADGLGWGRVNHLQFDHDGTLWVSTDGGLSRLKDGRLATLTGKNGLPCDGVYWTMKDDAHSVWLYMACGLVRISQPELDAWVSDPKRTIQATVFDSSDGIQSVAGSGISSSPVTKSADGKLWFTTLDGLSVFDPGHLPFNKLPPPVHFEKIVADHKTYDAAIDQRGQVRLPPRVRDVQIDYTALSLVAPEKVLFRYKLEGWDNDWQDAGTRRQAFYSNLPPRNYTFRVKACNNSGVWNEAGTSLNLFVAPAYYQKNWFRSLCVAAFLAIIWLIYQLRVRQLGARFNMRLEERVSERTRIARDLHDTLLQSFQGLMLHFQTGIDLLPGRPAEARKTLEMAIDRADQAIAEGRDAVQGLRTSTVETNDLASAVRILGEGLRAEGTNQNSALFEMEVEGTPRNLHPILRDEAYRIASEALRNAFRHARAQRIEVEILYGERWLRLRVRDDGKGIDPKLLSGDGLAGHYGLHGMRERAKLVGGKLAVWSKLDSGTEVELSIPASTAYANPARHRSRLFEKLSGKGTYFKETDVKETKTKS